MNEMTKEEIVAAYAAMMDSVDLIGDLRAKQAIDAEDQGALDRNIRHVKIMLAKNFWTDEDLDPARLAAASKGGATR